MQRPYWVYPELVTGSADIFFVVQLAPDVVLDVDRSVAAALEAIAAVPAQDRQGCVP